MKVSKRKNWASWMTAVAIASVVTVTVGARADLVFDEEGQSNEAAKAEGSPDRTSDRETTRQVMKTSEKAKASQEAVAAPRTAPLPQVVIQQQQPAPQPAVVVQTQAPAAPAAQAAEPAPTDIQNLSKAELLRRERMRTEVKNEDVLQERLEELRLRDENRRTQQLLGKQPLDAEAAAQVQGQAAAPAMAAPAMTEQVVAAPVTEHPGRATSAPAAAMMVAPAGGSDQLSLTQASAIPAGSSAADSGAFDRAGGETTRLTIAPRVGVASMKDDGYFQVKGHYTAGLTLGAEVSDNVAIEVGYAFNEFGVTPAGYPTNTSLNEVMSLKQNVFDLGMKLNMLGRSSKVRPFVSGGAGYSKGYVGLSSQLQTYYSTYYGNGTYALGSNCDISQFLGFLGTGLDVQVTRSIAVGAQFKYYGVLSSNVSFSNPSPGYYAPQDPNAAAKLVFGGSAAQASFYTMTVGATFGF